MGVTKGLKDSHARLIKAIKQSEKMTADRFSGSITVRHHDGSVFKFQNCTVRFEPKFVVVFQEHGCPVVFCIEDVTVGKFKMEVSL